MANYLYAVAPQDGTAIGMFPNTLIAAQAVGISGVQYDANRFSWLGSMSTSPLTFGVWHTAGVRSMADARHQGGDRCGFQSWRHHLHVPAHAQRDAGHEDQGRVRIPGQLHHDAGDGARRGASRHQLLGQLARDAPALDPRQEGQSPGPDRAEVRRSGAVRRAVDPGACAERTTTAGSSISSSPATRMGKPMAIAPNAPPERVQALRAAYEATLRDPDFIKAAVAARTRDQRRLGRAAAGDRARACCRRRPISRRARARSSRNNGAERPCHTSQHRPPCRT